MWYFSYADAFKIIDEGSNNRVINSTNIKGKGAFYLNNKYSLSFAVTSGLRIKEDNGGNFSPSLSYSKFSVRFSPKKKQGYIYSLGAGSAFPISPNYSDIPKEHDATFGPNASVGYIDPNYTIFWGGGYSKDFINTDSVRTSNASTVLVGKYALGKRFFIKGFTAISSDFAESSGNRIKVPAGLGLNSIVVLFKVPVTFGVNLSQTLVYPNNESKETTISFSISPILYKGKKE